MFRHCCSWFLRRCLAARWWSLSRKAGGAAVLRCRRGHRLLLLLRGLLLGLGLRFGLPFGFLVGFGFRVQCLGEVPARLSSLMPCSTC